MKKLSEFLREYWWAIAFLVIVIVFSIYNNNEKRRIQTQIDAIDNQLVSGRSSDELVSLYAKKKALLEQLKKLY